MKKRLVSIISLVLLTAMLCTLLNGCATTPAETQPADNGSTPSTDTTDQSSETTQAEDDIAWPEKAINMIIPASNSGDLDPVGRALAQALERELGVNVVVTNVKGSAGTIGSRLVMDADPDGYTFLYNNGQFVIAQANGTSDFGRDSFEVCATTGFNWGKVFTYNSGYDFKDIDDLIAYTQAHPYELTMADSMGTSTQIYCLQLERAGAKFKLVDYGSSGDKNAALLGGNVFCAWNKAGADLDNVLATGKVKSLFVAHEERCDYYPDLPTAAEQGYDDLIFDDRQFVLFPKGTDPAIVAKMERTLEKIITSDETYNNWRLEYNGTPSFFLDSEETAAWLDSFYENIAEILNGKDEIYAAAS